MINWVDVKSGGIVSRSWQKDLIKKKKVYEPLKMGWLACCVHCGSCWKASRSTKHWLHNSVTVSSSWGWKTLIKNSSRNEVSVLIAMPASWGTMSFSRWRNERDGGSSEPILNTLGSTSSLWPAGGPSWLCPTDDWGAPDRLWDLDTSPGTEISSIWSRSRWSLVRSADLRSISDNLKTRYEGQYVATRHLSGLALFFSLLLFWNMLPSAAGCRPRR